MNKWFFFCKPIDLTNCFSCSLFVSTCFFPCSSIVFVCFSKAFPNREYVNLACLISLLLSNGDISSPARYSHL